MEKTLEDLKGKFIRDITSIKGHFHAISKSEVKLRLNEILECQNSKISKLLVDLVRKLDQTILIHKELAKEETPYAIKNRNLVEVNSSHHLEVVRLLELQRQEIIDIINSSEFKHLIN